MTESPATIAQEAKNIHNSLKELLKSKELFDRDVDFQRKNLRRHYLNLLLVHPYARESKDVENHLWMQTSYLFIASYKTSIATLDREVMQNARQQQQHQQQRQQRQRQQPQSGEQQPQVQDQQQAQSQGPQHSNPHGVVEYRKRIQRFRQFLAEEEKFWTLLVQRMYRTFGLTEAKPALVELGLWSESEEAAAANDHSNTDGGDSTHPNRGRIPNGRNHHQFPPENPDLTALLPSPANRGSRLAIFSKALVCLGDIARYRELYNDSNGRPRAGHESMMPSRRRNRRGQEIAPRARNYDKAQKCYEQARSLVPNEGNPWHQLAILSSYQKDIFLSTVRHYRALCVQQPYDTAMNNLNVLLSKTLDGWKGRSRQEREKSQEQGTPPNVLVETFRERIIVLHALWRIGAEKGIERMDSICRKLDQLVHHDFNLLVSHRHLLPDTISQIIVLSESAFCTHRMIRPKTDRQLPANTSVLLDWRIIRHIFDLHSTLLDVGRAELAVPPPSDVNGGEDGLALKITAVFRRTLPGLRIASKWLLANYRTLMQDPEFIAAQNQETMKGIELSKDSPDKISGYSVQTIKFWENYIEFVGALLEAFPKNSLPALVSPLDEDLDMRGFLPLKKLMGENGEQDGQTREKPHPNVEQLMRIHDLLEDARLLSELPNSPIKLVGRDIVLNQDIIEKTRSRTHPGFSSAHEQELEVARNVSPTEEDVIDEAFRARDNGLLDQEFDDDEEIVYLQPSLSPVLQPAQSPPSRAPPTAPVRTLTSPTAISPKSPTNLPRQSHPPAPTLAPHIPQKTAEDLLKDVMSGVTNEPQPTRFLQSIWSASSDEQSLRFAAGGSPPKNAYQLPRQYQNDVPQTWTAPFSGSSHVGQPVATGTSPTAPSLARSPQLPPLTSRLNNQYHHQRIPSLPSPTYQTYSAFNHTELRDPLPYPHLAQPQQQSPLSRPAPTEQLPLSAFLSSQTMNSSLVNGAFGNPLVVGPTSSRYIAGSPLASPPSHARQASFGQPHHSPQQFHLPKPAAPGQPFASMPQAW